MASITIPNVLTVSSIRREHHDQSSQRQKGRRGLPCALQRSAMQQMRDDDAQPKDGLATNQSSLCRFTQIHIVKSIRTRSALKATRSEPPASLHEGLAISHPGPLWR